MRVFDLPGLDYSFTSAHTNIEVFHGAICEAFDVAPESATYQEQLVWTGWYDTNESQRLLQYQNQAFENLIDQLRALYKEALSSD